MSKQQKGASQKKPLSIAERINARRTRGDTIKEIGAYAHNLLQTAETCSHTQIQLSEDELQALLTPEEYRAFKRCRGGQWCARETRKLTHTRASGNDLPSPEAIARERERANAREHEETIAKQLRKLGAMSRSKVAAKLGINDKAVDRLRTRGLLVPDGNITIRGSYGRKCHVWLPTTVEAYLCRPIADISTASRAKR